METILLYAFVFALHLVFQVASKIHPQFKKAIDSYQAVYNFSVKSSNIYLIFDHSKIYIKTNYSLPVNFEIRFIDIIGGYKILREDPSNVMRLILENKIEKKGNLFYLFKFGFLISLCEKEFKRFRII